MHLSMRAVVQRVTSAAVEVEGKVVSSIQHGYLVLVGIGGNLLLFLYSYDGNCWKHMLAPQGRRTPRWTRTC